MERSNPNQNVLPKGIQHLKTSKDPTHKVITIRD